LFRTSPGKVRLQVIAFFKKSFSISHGMEESLYVSPQPVMWVGLKVRCDSGLGVDSFPREEWNNLLETPHPRPLTLKLQKK
jgi:hypothetical protein